MSAQNVKWPRSSVSRLVSSIVFCLIIGVSKEIGREGRGRDGERYGRVGGLDEM